MNITYPLEQVLVARKWSELASTTIGAELLDAMSPYGRFIMELGCWERIEHKLLKGGGCEVDAGIRELGGKMCEE
jgi:hypothetical protein